MPINTAQDAINFARSHCPDIKGDTITLPNHLIELSVYNLENHILAQGVSREAINGLNATEKNKFITCYIKMETVSSNDEDLGSVIPSVFVLTLTALAASCMSIFCHD